MNCNNCGKTVPSGVATCPCGARIYRHPAGARASPSSRADPEAAARALGSISPGKSNRNVLLPGESFEDYRKALRRSGLPEAAFEAKRLAGRGWTAAMERGFRDAAHACRLGTLPGATPEQIAMAGDPEARAERAAIQAEGEA